MLKKKKKRKKVWLRQHYRANLGLKVNQILSQIVGVRSRQHSDEITGSRAHWFQDQNMQNLLLC